MAEASKERTLEETSTWAVAVVCFVLVVISLLIECVIHLIGTWLTKKHKSALYEALEKIKAELMLLGFMSLLLTMGQGLFSDICISKRIAATWQPCDKKPQSVSEKDFEELNGRRLLEFSDFTPRRSLATKGYDKCTEKGKVAFVTAYGIHQLHMFIFVLAVVHVLYCITTLALGRIKMRKWKSWEKVTETIDYIYQNDPERFRLTKDTSFGRRHLNFWSKSSISLWIMCFFRQFIRSVTKVDYLTLRHGFIMAHLAPQNETRFDFQKYIKRSLEEDFKVVVGISPIIWLFAVLFLLLNTNGVRSYLWMPFIPLIILLLVGAKLQVIITKMGLRIQERGDVVKGAPLVQPDDHFFWFGRPRFMLSLIQFVLFQNAFQLAFFAWSTYAFGFKSCFHKSNVDIIIRLSMGVIIQFLCSYVTLPLYALVTQMGSTMRPTIFDDRVAKALKNWQRTAKKKRKHNKQSETDTPFSSRPVTPTHGMSPVHLLQNYKNTAESFYTSPRLSNFENDHFDAEGLPVMHPQNEGTSEIHGHDNNINEQVRQFQQPYSTSSTAIHSTQHEIEMGPI